MSDTHLPSLPETPALLAQGPSPSVPSGALFGWYVSFVAGKSERRLHDHKLMTEHPAVWALRTSRKYTDGPYVILSALPLTKEQYETARAETE